MEKKSKKEEKVKADYVTKKHFDLTVANVKCDILDIKDQLEVQNERQEYMISLLDKHLKQTEDMKDEFSIMKNEMGQVKQVIREKLGVKIRAIK